MLLKFGIHNSECGIAVSTWWTDLNNYALRIIKEEDIMRNYDLITPEGTKDLLFGECIIRRNIENSLMELFKSRGYSEIITPGLEFFDVFNLNSRYFPQVNLYKLTDSKGRLLVMRPDSTMPIARVVATRLREAELPLKFC